MIKVYCDFCNKDDKGETFRCQIDVVEVLMDLQSGIKQPKKDAHHCCQDCYKKFIKPNLYDRSKKAKD